jgi:hypothetical protein
MKWMSLAGHLACMEEVRYAYNILVRQPERKSFPGRCRYKWEVNIKMNLTAIGCEGVDWIHLVQDRVHCWAFVNRQKARYFFTS